MSLKNFMDSCPNEASLMNSFDIRWSVKGVGFGSYFFRVVDEGDVHIANEGMGKESIKKVLCQMVDDAILDDAPLTSSDVISTDERARQGTEPTEDEIIMYDRLHKLGYYASREILREKAYGGKPPHGYASWGDYWKNY